MIGSVTLHSADLIKVVETLLKSSRGNLSQAQLRRASSTIYYAMFHMLCRTAADLLVGPNKSTRSKGAWRQAYRAVEHRFTKQACKNKKFLENFPETIQDFANTFVAMQIKRHDADYDPYTRLKASEVRADLETAQQAMRGFEGADKKDRRAFATYVILKQRE